MYKNARVGMAKDISANAFTAGFISRNPVDRMENIQEYNAKIRLKEVHVTL